MSARGEKRSRSSFERWEAKKTKLGEIKELEKQRSTKSRERMRQVAASLQAFLNKDLVALISQYNTTSKSQRSFEKAIKDFREGKSHFWIAAVTKPFRLPNQVNPILTGSMVTIVPGGDKFWVVIQNVISSQSLVTFTANNIHQLESIVEPMLNSIGEFIKMS